MKPGTRVRVSYETTVHPRNGGILQTVDTIRVVSPNDPGGWLELATDAVEALPSTPENDPIGTRRKGSSFGTWIKTHAGWALIDRHHNYGDRDREVSWANELVTNSEISGWSTTVED